MRGGREQARQAAARPAEKKGDSEVELPSRRVRSLRGVNAPRCIVSHQTRARALW